MITDWFRRRLTRRTTHTPVPQPASAAPKAPALSTVPLQGPSQWYPACEPVSDAERAVLEARGLPVPERWIDQWPHPVPCRRHGPDPAHDNVTRRPFPPRLGPPPALPVARRLADGTGLYHLWEDGGGLRRDHFHCHCPPADEADLGDPVPAVLVPHSQKCWPRERGWSTYVPRIPRLRFGPLVRQWPHRVIPREYVWWRLYEVQDGRCALCWHPPNVIDHDHESGAVRGLLCWACNGQEGLYNTARLVCVHEPPYCFDDYRSAPPAVSFAWIWPVSPTNGRPLDTFRHADWPRVAVPAR